MWPDADIPRANPPPDTRLYAIGDIHGRADLLARLHAAISDDAAAAREPRKVLIYLGDYVDRGADSAGVIEMLLDRPLPGFETVHLMGNHEDLLLRFLQDPGIGRLWSMNGGAETLESYGLDGHLLADDRAGPALQAGLRARLPAAHLRFFQALAVMHIEGGCLFVHAGLRPGVPVDQQDAEDLLWIREPFLFSHEDFGYVVVHGHTPVEAPEAHFNRINVDTGAVWTDRLTAVVLSGDRYAFLHT